MKDSRQLLWKKNNTLPRSKVFFFIAVCLVLITCDAIFGETDNEQPKFKIVQNRDNGSFTIVPPDGLSPAKLIGLKELSEQEYDQLAQLPQWPGKTGTRSLRALPASVNNALKPYFRPIFSQAGGSCGQASGIGYAFTYEIDFQRNLAANVEANQYPTHYTWNFLNGGFGGGSWYFDGWDIIKDNGCPNVVTWGEMNGDDTRWMSGYDKYYAGMANRVLSYEQIAAVNTPAGLDNLKQWLYDRGNGSAAGGVGCYAAYIYNTEYVILPPGTPEAGKQMLIQWGNSGYHAMTVVGYDDTVRHDFNGDGQYTNNIDLNGDGVITMNDWEIGALIFANSWGTGYGNNGFCYMAYKAIADQDKRGAEALTWNSVHIVHTTPVTNPKLTLKVQLTHTGRSYLNIYASAEQGGSSWTKYFSRMFWFNGGNLPMQGRDNNAPIELGLDVTSLFEQIDPYACADFKLNVQEADYAGVANGQIISYSLIDYTDGTPLETICNRSYVPIANNTLTTLSVTRCPTPTLRAQYFSYSRNPQANTISVNFRIYNDGPTAVKLENISSKYWYTADSTTQSEIADLDWAGILPAGTDVTAAARYNVSPISQGGQTRVCTISFIAGAGTIQPQGYVDCNYRIHKSNWTNYTQPNDYSFGTQTAYMDWQKLSVYVKGVLAWGIEP